MKTKEEQQPLPRDVDALIAIIGDKDGCIASLESSLATLQNCVATLEHNLKVYARMIFGKSSEKRRLTGVASGNPHQLHLFIADLIADAERVAEETGATGHIEVKQPETSKQPKEKGRRKKFPEHLPVVESVFELPEDQRVCQCGGALHEIGFEESRELERIELTVVHKTKRTKYACRSCTDGVTTAPGPARVIEKGMLGVGFLAHVACERFLFHMPYYRLEKKYGSEGLDLSRSVLERSMARSAQLLEPLHTALRQQVLAQDIVFTDDTTVTLVDPSSPGGSRKGRVWIYLDKRGRHYYDFTESRERDGPIGIFEDYQGYIQADAYPVYDALFQSDAVTEVACWAHTRRYFEKASSSDPSLSEQALDLIGELYRIEKSAKVGNLDPADVAALRQEHSIPVLLRIRSWLAVTEAQVLPKSPMGKAVQYAQNHWEALTTYVQDGRLEIDNNRAERAMRPIAVGRKGWLFYQTKGGGKTASILMSLIQTAEAAGVNVKLYLRDVLLRIATETDVSKLLPHEWKRHFEEEVVGRRNEIVQMLVKDQDPG